MNQLVDGCNEQDEKTKYYSIRAVAYFHMRKWKGKSLFMTTISNYYLLETLEDISKVENYQQLNGTLSIIKQQVLFVFLSLTL